MNDETVYIFLDIDGVLNNDMARKKYRGTDMRMLNDNNLAELANLVNKINKHYLIVLISTWRYYIDNINILKKSRKNRNHFNEKYYSEEYFVFYHI